MSFYLTYPILGGTGGSSGVVTSLNGLTGALTLVGAGGITITPSGSNITITGTGGTVTSVGLSLPAEFSVSGSPVTSSGTLSASWVSEAQHAVFAAPSGSSGTPSFRALVAGDIPALPYAPSALTQNHVFVGNASNVATDVAMSGDLSIVASGATTLVKIQGTTVSGTTGTGNVVFSASPTLTGTTSAGALTLTTPLAFQYQGAVPEAFTYYVDKNRTDSYTADGTVLRPYKTIQAAINAAIGSGSAVAAVLITGPGEYNENLTFNNLGVLEQFWLQGFGQVYVNPLSGLSFDSSVNNNNGDILQVNGIKFASDVQVIGSADNASIFATDMSFNDCEFIGNVTIENIVGGVISGSHAFGNVTFQNIGGGGCGILGGIGMAGGTLSVITNNAAPKPSGFSQTICICEKTVLPGPISVDAGSSFQIIEGVRAGAPSQNVSINGTFTSYSSYIRGNILLASGSVWTNNASFYDPSLVVDSGCTFTNNTFSKVVQFTPAVSGNWTTQPNNVKDALDILAANKASNALTSAHIFVGNGSNVATDVAMTGDIAITNAGVTSYSGTVPVNKGGTGQTSLTAHDVLVGNGTSAVTLISPSTAGYVLTSNGTGADPSFQAPVSPLVDSTIDVYGGNGYGSTNNKVRRFTSVNKNTGSPSMTYADDASLGMSVTINIAGLYMMTYVDSANANMEFGFGLNASGTTSIASLGIANKLNQDSSPNALESCVTAVRWLSVNDVITAQTDGTTSGLASGGTYCRFTIVRLA